MSVTVNLADLGKLMMWCQQYAKILKNTGGAYNENKASAILAVVSGIGEEYDNVDD